MSPEPVNKPPTAGSGGEGGSGKTVNSSTGWRSLTHTLAYKVPAELRTAKRARQGVYRLIRTGR